MRPNQILTCLPKIYDIMASKDRHILYTELLYIYYFDIYYILFVLIKFVEKWLVFTVVLHML